MKKTLIAVAFLFFSACSAARDIQIAYGDAIQVHGNGQVVDFFAERDNSWYHVQAGDLETLNHH